MEIVDYFMAQFLLRIICELANLWLSTHQLKMQPDNPALKI